MSLGTATIGTLSPPPWVKPTSPGGRSLLDLLLKKGPTSQAALTAALDISQPSVARLVSGFLADGAVKVSERVAQGRGNPSVQVALDPDYAYGLGVSLSGDSVSLTLLDMTGRPRSTRAVAMPDMAPQIVLDRLFALKSELLTETSVDPSRIVGAGVGFSGFFVADPLRFNPPQQLRGWAQIDVADALSQALDLSVIGENDGTAAAVAESLLGVGRTCSTFAYCHLTNGFGGGLIVDGRPLRGAMGNAGDFGGVLWLLDDGYPNLDLLRSTVEAAGSAFDTVEEMVRTIRPETPGVSDWISDAQRPIAKLAFLLGHILAPERVVIGGRLPVPVAQALADAVSLPQTPTRNAQPFPLPRVVASEVNGDAVAIGAALMPLQALFFA